MKICYICKFESGFEFLSSAHNIKGGIKSLDGMFKYFAISFGMNKDRKKLINFELLLKQSYIFSKSQCQTASV